MKLLGRGNTAEVYEYTDDKVCKLFYGEYPREYVEMEFQNAREMYKCGIKVPYPFQVVTEEKRVGIIYERISGKTLLDLMFAHAEKWGEYLDLFVKLHQDMMRHCSKNGLSYKEYLTMMVRKNVSDCGTILERINTLPEGNCILHGDFHPGNILIEKDGTPVIIDFMNVCRGPALYDVARSYFLIKQADAGLADRYLQKMHVSERDIVDYLDIIAICREYEG